MTWNEQWEKESQNDYWKTPDTDVQLFFSQLNARDCPNVLDYGCGIGRHTIMLAGMGFRVRAIDISENAINYLRRWQKEKQYSFETMVTDLTNDAGQENKYDAVLAFNVIYHNTRDILLIKLDAVRTALKPDGFFYFTIPTRQDGKYGSGKMVEPHTYLPGNSIHPGDVHYFADEKDLVSLLDSFYIFNLKRDEHFWNNNGTQQFSSMWKAVCKPKS
ncbi:MAG: class I SAM-dependent methyltransferase [Spirochaetales bacterium]|nr:class I SAM-dependent methyltransferase [Spirochaetales bacterium]